MLGTSSSESALVPLMQKLERLGCSRSVVGLVVPSGNSFNLDGTNIYLTMAALFVAQAMNIELSLRQQVTLLGVAMLTSKGASGVTGAGFITLAATLAVVPRFRLPVWRHPRRRSLHVRSPVAHQLRRQRRRGNRCVALGERARHEATLARELTQRWRPPQPARPHGRRCAPGEVEIERSGVSQPLE